VKLSFKIFESDSKPWSFLCEQAAAFAGELPDGALVNVSTAAAGGAQFGGLGATGIVIVWYWK